MTKRFSILVTVDHDDLRKLVNSALELIDCDLETSNQKKQNLDVIIADEQSILRDPDFVLNLEQIAARPIFIVVTDVWCEQSEFVWLHEIIGADMVVSKWLIASPHFERVLSRGRCEPELDKTVDTKCSVVHCTDEKTASVHNAIEETRKRLRIELRTKWRELAEKLRSLESNTSLTDEISECVQAVHRFKGSAGSLGLQKVSKSAQKIEFYLNNFYPKQGAAHQLLWSAINDQLDYADSVFDLVEPVEKLAQPSSTVSNPRVAYVGADPRAWREITSVLQQLGWGGYWFANPISLNAELETVFPDLLLLDEKLDGLCVDDLIANVAQEYRSIPFVRLCEGNGIDFDGERLSKADLALALNEHFQLVFARNNRPEVMSQAKFFTRCLDLFNQAVARGCHFSIVFAEEIKSLAVYEKIAIPGEILRASFSPGLHALAINHEGEFETEKVDVSYPRDGSRFADLVDLATGNLANLSGFAIYRDPSFG